MGLKRLLHRSGDDSRTEAAARELDRITIFGQQHILTAWIDAGGRRLTDLLNGQTSVSVSPADEAPTRDDEWVLVDRDAILVVVPPQFTGDRQLRVHRRRVEVRVELGDYSIVGTAYLPAGGSFDVYQLHARQPFMPVTDASVENPNLGLSERFGVVLVNIGNVEQLHGLEAD